MSTTDMGRLGEAKVIARLVELGWYPFTDLSGKCPVDIIAWKDGVVKTFQVKTTRTKTPSDRWAVEIGNVRPNRKQSIIHKYDNSKQDYLAVFIVPENTVTFIKSSTISAGRRITINATSNEI